MTTRTEGNTTILVVDDSAFGRRTMQALLERRGFQVITAEDGYEAVETATRVRPAAVLLDMVMPVMDGFGAVRELRARPETAATPVLGVTGLDGAGQARALAAGCNAVLARPVSPDALVSALRGWLGQAAGQQSSSRTKTG